jgi:hypothetical protein
MKKAFECYKLASQFGYAEAQYSLAICYENALGCEKDERKAVEWYIKGGIKGYKGACNALGLNFVSFLCLFVASSLHLSVSCRYLLRIRKERPKE